MGEKPKNLGEARPIFSSLSQPLVFVVGCPRSGTTLMATLLDRHSLISVPPETNFCDEIGLGPWQSLEECRARLNAWRRLPEFGIGLTELLAEGERIPEPAHVLGRLLDIYRSKRGKAFAGEKTPQHLFHVEHLARVFPAAKFLCMFRDGLSNVMSLADMPWWEGGFEAAVKMWCASEKHAQAMARLMGGGFMRVSLSNLSAFPEQELRRVMSFLGLSFEERQLDPGTPSGTVLPRSMQWKGSSLAFPSVDIADRRAATATPEQEAAFNRIQRRLLSSG